MQPTQEELREIIAKTIYDDFPERIFDPSKGYHTFKEWGDPSITSMRAKHVYALTDKIMAKAFPDQPKLL